MKNLPNLITMARILGTAVLVLIAPFSIAFFIIYFICGMSDILDGMLARRMNLVSEKGQLLDSIADFIMIAVILYILVTNIRFPLFVMWWVGSIAFIRLTSLGVGFVRYKQLAFLHTYANKFTGLMLFSFPLIYVLLGMDKAAIIVCFIATLSAVEELIINVVSKRLYRDIRSIFY